MKVLNRRVAYMLVTILLAVNCMAMDSVGAVEAVHGDSPHTPVSVAGGGGHGVAAWSDGSVTAWGYNKSGQVGDGTSIHQLVPKQVAGLTDIVQVAAGTILHLPWTRTGTCGPGAIITLLILTGIRCYLSKQGRADQAGRT